MENTNIASIEIESNDEEESLSPWPRFKKFMRFKKANVNNYLFECKLCIPKVHEIRAHKSCYNNEKSHFQKKHPSRLKEVEDVCKTASLIRRKKRSHSLDL